MTSKLFRIFTVQYSPVKIQSVAHLYSILPENERLIVDMLRQIIIENLPPHCKEKIAYNVPFFRGNKGICIVWPATVPRGGIKEGVLLGFWYGNRLEDTDEYLVRGTNKQIFYIIFKSHEEIDPAPIIQLLKEAVRVDESGSKKRIPNSR